MKKFIGTEPTELMTAEETKLQKVITHNLSMLDLHAEMWVENDKGDKAFIYPEKEGDKKAMLAHSNSEFEIKVGEKLMAKAEKEEAIIVDLIDFTNEELNAKIAQIEKNIDAIKLNGAKKVTEITGQIQQYETGLAALEESYLTKKAEHKTAITNLTANKKANEDATAANEANALVEIEMYRSFIKP